ncbi:methylmalonyl Co-A mutase-associated GTPase MeaB [Natranaeroarchaeum aerophilus]|uniref:Methylmalonyl Co-A mutase-associated GTPase MeaB n=1 Tax=Natranaeroarchaeum aerophilus TaxID=2917711 RepID=A0AAE3FQB7_9EURY|nr:methylmalonyl Co-A mutase-associated GTPase MeaB [Natranaeroarchaeum aerophilus]MCL9813196.1 methylmalonyl Co-A mutase-associated GTPase MeaB [Natranaeroarchaeum aerophilus]
MSDTRMELVDDLLAGDYRALARAITTIENRQDGYRDLVATLHEHTGNAEVIGITGSPGSGKSTLVDKLALAYRERGERVGIVAVDPSSPYTGGAVLGDRIRMASSVGDMDVFVRSMSARGSLGGLSMATADAVTAFDAFGMDRVIIETVGAGQNEIDVVRAADTVAVLVPPGSGDTVQTLKAGILEIADVFVVNKADLDGADRTVTELREMVGLGNDVTPILDHSGKQGRGAGDVAAGDTTPDNGAADTTTADATPNDEAGWTPPIVETVATRGDGVDELIAEFEAHASYLDGTGRRAERERTRSAEELRRLLRSDLNGLVEAEIERRGGIDALVDEIVDGRQDPYSLADSLLAPVEDCLTERTDE